MEWYICKTTAHCVFYIKCITCRHYLGVGTGGGGGAPGARAPSSFQLKCLLLVNDNLVTKGGCLVAALAKSKMHTTFIIVILLMASRTIMESPERT